MLRIPTAPWAHLPFDLAAWASGLAFSVILYRWRLSGVAQGVAAKIDGVYFAALAIGAALGGWTAGSLNTLREHAPALSHSVSGALIGAIVGVEIYKALRGVKGSTGGVFVGSFTLGVVIGRLACFFAGLADDTYGTTTRLPWGVDLGDGVSRHPVQLYESASMAVFLVIYLMALKQRRAWAMRRGFYVMCIWYGLQRFIWEFLKPYPRLIGPFNVFHILCLGLVIYGWVYYRTDRRRELGEEGCFLSVSGPDLEPVRSLP
jgi:hypothetical protein